AVKAFESSADRDAVGNFGNELDHVTASADSVAGKVALVIRPENAVIDRLRVHEAEVVERLVIASLGDRTLLTSHQDSGVAEGDPSILNAQSVVIHTGIIGHV